MSAKVIPLRSPRFAPGAELSDEALIAACAAGDAAALTTLFDRHHLRVHRFLFRIAGGPGAELEDLLQETFTSVWSSAARYRGDAPALTWIFGIAAHIGHNYQRGRQRRARAMSLLAEIPSVPPEGADDAAVRQQALRRLERALSELTPDQRVAFAMCDLEGISGVDAAKSLGVRPGTIWRRLHEARSALRAMMKEEPR